MEREGSCLRNFQEIAAKTVGLALTLSASAHSSRLSANPAVNEMEAFRDREAK